MCPEDEFGEHLNKTVWKFFVGEVTGAINDFDARSGKDLPGIFRVPDRYHRVPAAPHHAGRHVRCKISAIGHGDHLPPPIDHRAQHMQEGIPLGRVPFPANTERAPRISVVPGK